MDDHKNHGDLISGFLKDQQEVFNNSTQGMYAFLDDDSRICNEKFATLLGYGSSDEWAKIDVHGSFPDTFVDNKSQESLVTAYQHAMEKMIGSTIKVSWKKKNGGTVDTTVILVPVVYQGHVLALHFVS